MISSSNTTPNFNDTIINSTNDSNEFHFSVDDQILVSNLELNTTYYIRAFAQHIDGLGTSFSKTLTFKTLSEDQNGNIIYSKTYGNQEWSTQNADVITYRDGTPIPEVAYNEHSTFMVRLLVFICKQIMVNSIIGTPLWEFTIMILQHLTSNSLQKVARSKPIRMGNFKRLFNSKRLQL